MSDSEFSENEEEGLDAWDFDGTDLSLINVMANDNESCGIWAGDGVRNVTIDQSESNGNYYEGMYFEEIYYLTMTDSEASENGLDDESDGIYAEVYEANLDSVTANNNYGHGIYISGENNMILKNITASENDFDGIDIYTEGDVAITGNNETNNNGDAGLELDAEGDISPSAEWMPAVMTVRAWISRLRT